MPGEPGPDLKFEIGHVLFIDIIGYSKLLINEQSEQLQTLKQIVRGTEQFRLAEAEGKLLRLPTGDGGALVFRNSSEAPVMCALEISKALKSHPEVQVRMGIHSGPVNEVADLNERMNVAGAGINIAQRVMDCGDAGHILLSRHVAEDLEHYPRWQAHLHELGECEVKHGVRISVVNLYNEDLGNPAVPERLRKAEATVPPAQPTVAKSSKPTLRLVLGIVSLAALATAMMVFTLLRPKPTASGDAAMTGGGSVIPRKSIAILPFSDLSPNRDQESFSDGMAEEILNALAHIKDLKVVGRASSFYYKGKTVSLKQIGSELGVANVLEGSVRKQGEQVRITSALSRTADGLQVWSKNYNGTLANIFDLQESFARDIAGELNVVLADPSEARLVEKPTDNAQAYALFIEAQTLVSRRVGDSLPRAIALLEEATRLDPKFARAWAKLAVALAVAPQYTVADWQTNWAAADTAAHRAIAVDAKSAEAYAALGYIDFSRRRYRDMVEPAQRATMIDPNDVTANFWMANQLAATGRTAEAEAVNERALKADPGNALVIFYKGLLRWRAGDFDTALKLAKRVAALGGPFAGLIFFQVAAKDGDHDRGAEEFARGFGAYRTEFTKDDFVAIYRGVYGDEAARKAALVVVARHSNDEAAGTMLLLLAEPEQSFAKFERSSSGLSDGYLNWLWIPQDYVRKARQNPAFQSFAKRIGLVDYWKQNRWPDLCQPTPERGPDAFTCQ